MAKIEAVEQQIKDRDTDGVLAALAEHPELATARVKENNRPLLHMAALYGNAPVVARFLELGADANCADSSGRTALMNAGSRDVVDLLMEGGANLEGTDDEGDTAIHHMWWTTEVLEALLDRGLDIDTPGKAGRPVLARVFDVDAARLLLERGADPNARDDEGETATYHALFGFSGARNEDNISNIVAMFVEHGADLNARSDKGITILKLVAPMLDPTLPSDVRGPIRTFCQALIDNGATVPEAPDDQEEKSSGCFVATACYGSPDHPDVIVLRRYREHALKQTAAGLRFIALYYWLSPPVADWIAKGMWRRALMRRIVVQPIAAWAAKRLSG